MNRPALLLALICLAPLSAWPEPKSAPSPDDTREVLVATRDLAAGETVTVKDLRARRIKAKWITSSLVGADSEDVVVNQRLRFPVLAGGLLTWSMFRRDKKPVLFDACARAVHQPATADQQVARARARVLSRRTPAPARKR